MKELAYLEREQEILHALLLHMQNKIQYYEMQVNTLVRSMGLYSMQHEDLVLIQKQLEKYMQSMEYSIKMKKLIKDYLDSIHEKIAEIVGK